MPTFEWKFGYEYDKAVFLQCGYGGCHTGDGIMSRIGRTGKCGPFSQLFHFQCDIHTVVFLFDTHRDVAWSH